MRQNPLANLLILYIWKNILLSLFIYRVCTFNILIHDHPSPILMASQVAIMNVLHTVHHRLFYELFYIWNILGYQNPETGTFQYLASVMDLKVQLRKASLLLTDGTCSCNGPILEILLKNLVLRSDTTGSAMKASLASDMLVNYFNIQKVMWEPFIETWDFKLDVIRTQPEFFSQHLCSNRYPFNFDSTT
ncbi:hypothetical protein IFM89_028192 [Coptis chinensis]|uniref:Uncharacterized protein n=1 Tax=Coptis chinensis TaxID=261450 RepID=A0A835HDN5_9MAGN|nr:hypothetical protein IFM89_028192 [Coptis chinensis]